MEQLREGLWWWTGTHPDWTPDDGGPDGWGAEVSSYAFDCGGVFVLVDPISPPSVIDELAEGRRVAVGLTSEWHGRSTGEVVARLGASVGPMDGCVEVKASLDGDHVLWIPAYGALVFGDLLIAEPGELRIPDAWLNTKDGETHESRAQGLRHLLELPVEHALPTHGRPSTRADLERALA